MRPLRDRGPQTLTLPRAQIPCGRASIPECGRSCKRSSASHTGQTSSASLVRVVQAPNALLPRPLISRRLALFKVKPAKEEIHGICKRAQPRSHAAPPYPCIHGPKLEELSNLDKGRGADAARVDPAAMSPLKLPAPFNREWPSLPLTAYVRPSSRKKKDNAKAKRHFQRGMSRVERAKNMLKLCLKNLQLECTHQHPLSPFEQACIVAISNSFL